MTRHSWWTPVLMMVIISISTRVYFLTPTRPTYVMAIRDREGQFEFIVDELPDGRHRYTASLKNMPFPVPDEEETGELTEADWISLSSFQCVTKIPDGHEPFIEEPWSEWGTLERGDSTIRLRAADWWAIEDSVPGKAIDRLIFKAKADI